MASLARASLAELLDASIALSPADAVAVLVQLARAPQIGRPLPLQLDPSHVWLEASGAASLSPGLYPHLGEFAALLARLLSPLGDGVPRALRILVDRVTGEGPTAAIPSLHAFAAALAPFQPEDPAAAVSALVARFAEAVTAPPPAPLPAAPLPAVLVAPVAPAAPAAVAAAPAPPAVRVVPPPVAPPVQTLPQPVTPPTSRTRVARTAWRPSALQVGGALAAMLVAAVLGSSLAQMDDRTEPAQTRQAPSAARQARAEAPPPQRTVEVIEVETPVAKTAPDSGSDPESSPESNPESSPESDPESSPESKPEPVREVAIPLPDAEPVVARPARLVDRRDVEADAVFSPSFANNGTAVFFHAESGNASALKRADARDGELRVASIVEDGARNYHVQVSPDGRQVAFDSDRDGVRGVYVADADGRGVRRVSGPGYAAVPSWSPDGRQLAFLRGEPDRPAVWNLWLLDRASGRQARLTTFRRGQVWGGAWFPDGRRIAYSHEDRLILHDLRTGRARTIASPLRGRLVRTPAVSPDGRWVIFQVYRDGVWLFDAERGGMQRVLDDPSAEEFAWSPDGRRVAYHSRRSGGWNLWTMALP